MYAMKNYKIQKCVSTCRKMAKYIEICKTILCILDFFLFTEIIQIYILFMWILFENKKNTCKFIQVLIINPTGKCIKALACTSVF